MPDATVLRLDITDPESVAAAAAAAMDVTFQISVSDLIPNETGVTGGIRASLHGRS